MFNKTDTTSLVGAAITWTSGTYSYSVNGYAMSYGCIYNTAYNIWVINIQDV